MEVVKKLLVVGALAALVSCGGEGATGPAGATGADGEKGPKGKAGEDGLSGQGGQDGQDGDDGQDGVDGQDGGGLVDVLAVPSYGPESIVAASDDTLYVSSIGDGSITTIAPDRVTVGTFIPAETTQPMGKTGMLVDEVAGEFWACAVGTDFVTASELRRYQLSDGAPIDSFPMATGHEFGFCNDIAMDGAGNVYITDSFIGIQRLPAGGAALESWSVDPLYGPLVAGDFAIDGIVLDGTNLYVNNLETGELYRVGIDAGGAAEAPVVIGGVTMSGPDGMRLMAPDTLIVAEGGGAFGGTDSLTRIDIDTGDDTATRTQLSNRLDRPAAVALSQGDAWVSEGQIGRIFGLDVDGAPPFTPFLVRRVELFQ